MYESKDKMVSHPKHYKLKNGMEVIDVIDLMVDGLEGMEAVDTANAIKYLARWHKKGNCLSECIRDLEKSEWYISHLIALMKAKLAENNALTITVEDLSDLGDVDYRNRSDELKIR